MASGEKQKPGPHPHLTPEELVMDQNDAGSSSSSISVTDQMEEDVYDGDTLSCGSRSDCSSLTEMDDDLLRSLGEELGMLQEEETTTSTFSECPSTSRQLLRWIQILKKLAIQVLKRTWLKNPWSRTPYARVRMPFLDWH
jgi:hypothetical protein